MIRTLDPETRRRAREREDELELYEIGLAVNRAEGKAEGRLEGKAEILLKLLSLRFGPLDGATRARVEAAPPEQLDAWAERVLSAPTLADALATF
ncbi:MAG: DUF4351 domain-containing protein [Myxococcales bacterium]|nr:DUF4351 domain-containing protein [Myxococcales bacterium]